VGYVDVSAIKSEGSGHDVLAFSDLVVGIDVRIRLRSNRRPDRGSE